MGFRPNRHSPIPGSIIRFFTECPFTDADVFTFSTAGLAPTQSDDLAKTDAFLNPYYGIFNLQEERTNRFITFTHLPEKTIIRIFNLAGILVRTLEKSDALQHVIWDLNNESGRLVSNGLFIARIELPDLGVEKNLKLAIVHK